MSLTKTNMFLVRTMAIILIVVGVLFLSGTPQEVLANRGTSLRNQINQLEKEIAKNKAKAEHLHSHAQTLAEAVHEANERLAVINRHIQLLELKLKDLGERLAETRAELARQKQILREALRESYMAGDVRTLELVVNSDNFSDFFDQKEYMDRVRATVHDSALKIAELEEKLDQQRKEQQGLLNEQEKQRASEQAVRAAKQRLLNETRGQEARFRARVAAMEKEQRAVELALDAYIASLVSSGVSLGPISKGSPIGQVGMSGFSSGPHLHLGAQRGSGNVNPSPLFSQLGWQWPLPGHGMSSGYGRRCFSGYCDFHTGIDITAPIGTPILAVDDGEIIHRGCTSVGTRFANYSVFIRHSGGYVSRYVHLKAPPGGAYNACRANTW